MPLQKLTFRAGFNTERSSYANEGGWESGNKVRFRFGRPEVIGGWQPLTTTTMLGTCRAILPWFDLSGVQRLGLGTNQKYYVEQGGVFTDITPIRATTAAGDITFSATDGSSEITVTHAAHNATAGDFITFSGAVSLGGAITADVLNQEYAIEEIVSTSEYTIVARTAGTSIADITVDGALDYTAVTANASDTGSGGSSVVGEYQLPTVSDSTTIGAGWGTGTWSRGTWSSSAETAVAATQIPAWSHDTFGEDLLMCRRGGPIYTWDTSDPLLPRATNIADLSGSEIPVVANRVMVSDRDRHVLALGANPEGTSSIADLDPMLIRFSQAEDYTTWNTASTTTAGSLQLGSGSEIVTGVETRQQTLVFTDTALYTVQFIGPPFTFGATLVSNNTTIASPEAAASVDDRVFWMGDRGFYMFDGAVQTLRCDVLGAVFDTMDDTQRAKVACGVNAQFNEVWWFYPCTLTGECDRYVVYNYGEDVWYTGTLSRSAWVDMANGTVPIAANPYTGQLYYHETGLDDGSADPAQAINAYIESSPLDIGDGEGFVFLQRAIPDVEFTTSTAATPALTLTTTARNTTVGDFSQSYDNAVTSETEIVYLRLRGRQFRVRLESNEVGVTWRLGDPRYDFRTDGRR